MQSSVTNLSKVNFTGLNGEEFDGTKQLQHKDIITIHDRSFRFELLPHMLEVCCSLLKRYGRALVSSNQPTTSNFSSARNRRSRRNNH